MDEARTTVTVSIIFTVLAGVVVTLRCVSRFIVVRQGGWDDYTAIVAYMSSLWLTCMIYIQKRHGMGNDIDKLPPHEVTLINLYFWIGLVAYGAAISIVKISACLQYLRFLVERWQRLLSWATIVASIVFGVVAVTVNTFECQPVSFSWDWSIPNGKCIDLGVWWFFAAAWIIFTDLVVVGLPIIALKGLNLPRQQKIALIFVFALSGLGCCMSIYRVHILQAGIHDMNTTKSHTPGLLWSSMEINIGVICISIPPMKALVLAVAPRLIGSNEDAPADNRRRLSSDEMQLRAPGAKFPTTTTRPKGELATWASDD